MLVFADSKNEPCFNVSSAEIKTKGIGLPGMEAL
jgi:hypothetical protein